MGFYENTSHLGKLFESSNGVPYALWTMPHLGAQEKAKADFFFFFSHFPFQQIK